MKTTVSFPIKQSFGLRLTILIILVASSLLTANKISSAQRVSSQSPNTEKSTTVSGVKFIVPKDFRLEESLNSGFAFMRHESEQLALFIAVPNQQVDDAFLTNLSSEAVVQLLPQQDGFTWKILRHSEPKMSRNQSMRGTTKGLNNQRYVQADFVVVKVQHQEIVLGSISVFGNEKDAKYHFDIEGIDYSFIGWEGLFKLIASVTGEKYDR